MGGQGASMRQVLPIGLLCVLLILNTYMNFDTEDKTTDETVVEPVTSINVDTNHETYSQPSEEITPVEVASEEEQSEVLIENIVSDKTPPVEEKTPTSSIDDSSRTGHDYSDTSHLKSKLSRKEYLEFMGEAFPIEPLGRTRPILEELILSPAESRDNELSKLIIETLQELNPDLVVHGVTCNEKMCEFRIFSEDEVAWIIARNKLLKMEFMPYEHNYRSGNTGDGYYHYWMFFVPL